MSSNICLYMQYFDILDDRDPSVCDKEIGGNDKGTLLLTWFDLNLGMDK